jgi:hypothetical protein
MRYLTAVTLVLVFLAGIVHAQGTSNITTPPGAILLTEVNLSESDILGMIKESIPAFAQAAAGAPGELGLYLKNADLNTLSDAIRDIKQIIIVQFQVPPKTDIAKTLAFFESSLPSADGWSRMLYDTSTLQKGAIAVYTNSGQDFFAVAVDPAKNRVYAARTIGFVDVPKLAAWAAKVAKFNAEMEAKKAAKPAPAKKPVKKAPVKKTTTKSKTKR